MLNEPTIEQLRKLKLNAMAAAWTAQQSDPSAQALSFDERFALLVAHEIATAMVSTFVTHQCEWAEAA